MEGTTRISGRNMKQRWQAPQGKKGAAHLRLEPESSPTSPARVACEARRAAFRSPAGGSRGGRRALLAATAAERAPGLNAGSEPSTSSGPLLSPPALFARKNKRGLHDTLRTARESSAVTVGGGKAGFRPRLCARAAAAAAIRSALLAAPSLQLALEEHARRSRAPSSDRVDDDNVEPARRQLRSVCVVAAGVTFAKSGPRRKTRRSEEEGGEDLPSFSFFFLLLSARRHPFCFLGCLYTAPGSRGELNLRARAAAAAVS